MQPSRGNGPGLRYTIWTQGCALNCRGCFNPTTHASSGGKGLLISEIAAEINDSSGIEGVTLSGGEPLDQANAIALLVPEVSSDLTWILYTGYTTREIFADQRKLSVVGLMDLTISGRFQRQAAHPYMRKKIIKTTSRVDPSYFSTNRQVQFTVSSSSVLKTGIVSQ